MGLLDSFMPGEPDVSGGLLNDRYNNPLLQIGLGILANNNTKNLGQVLGRGALQGIGNVQQFKKNQQEQKYQQIRQKQLENEMAKQEREQKALADFDIKFPEYKGLAEIDPKSALKIAYPALSANSADPYFTPLATESGLGSFNNRTGKYELITGADGRPVIKTTDSPLVRGAVKDAEAQAGASWKPNTDIDGQVLTDEQVANMARGNRPAPFSTPQMPQGLPRQATPNNMQIQPQVQKQREDMRMQILLNEQMQSGGAGANPELDKEIANMRGFGGGGGIRVPTKAELAGQAEQAKANVNLAMNPAVEAATVTAKANAENSVNGKIELPKIIDQSNNTIKLVDDLINHKGLDTATGLSSKIDPRNFIAGTDATNFNIRLDQLKGQQFLEAFQSLKGGGQITEVEGKKATDAISRMNTSASKEEFVKAAKEFQDVIRTGVNRAKMKAGNGAILPSTEKMPNAMALPKNPSALTLRKGTVYSTPKGNLRWNGKAFED